MLKWEYGAKGLEASGKKISYAIMYAGGTTYVSMWKHFDSTEKAKDWCQKLNNYLEEENKK